MKKTVCFYTLGCKVNHYETDVMRRSFKENGYDEVPFPGPADVTVINTCTVTAESDRKSRNIIRRAKKAAPDTVTVAVGCMSQVSASEVAKMPEADVVIGCKEKASAPLLAERFMKERETVVSVFDIRKERLFEEMCVTEGERTRAAVKVQDGCDNFCSYCMIPFARGPIRSKPIESALSEIKGLVSAGYKEIVLTGIHLDNYGKERGDVSLLDLLERADETEGLERIRLSSLEPTFITEESVMRMSRLKHLCPHFHLSLQSGCTETLKRMNRKYTAEEYKRAADLLKAAFSDCSLTADVIVGFPLETEEDLEESLRFCKEIGFLKVHVFPYSPRRGTKAAAMPQVAPEEKARRSRYFISEMKPFEAAFLKGFEGREMPVLFETEKDGAFIGHTANYLEVHVRSDRDLTNEIVPVLLERARDGYLDGTLSR